MRQGNPFTRGTGRMNEGDKPATIDTLTPPDEARAESLQRLQIGLFGIGAMVLLVGLASIIGSQAEQAEESAVPEAAPTTEPTAAAQQSNPLADAGVVPDISAEPSPAPIGDPLVLPPPSERPTTASDADER